MFNTSAHQINGSSVAHDFAPRLPNGAPLTSSPTNDTQSSFEFNSSLPNSADTGVTRNSLPASSGQPSPEENKIQETLKVDEPLPASVLPIVQPPTSDVREQIQPPAQTASSELEIETQECPQSNPLEKVSPSNKLPSSSESILAPSSPPKTETSLSASKQEPSDISVIQGKKTSAHSSVDMSDPGAAAVDETLYNATTKPSDQLPVPAVNDAALEKSLDPAPSSAPPATASDASSNPDGLSADQIMQHAPASPPKVARPRDEDEMTDAPAAKRTKTEEEGAEVEFKVPDRPANDAQTNGSHAESLVPAALPMTKPQQKYLQRTIGNVKRIAAAKSFLLPVDYVALRIPSYPTIIQKPMDLKTLEDNLRAEKYPSVEACVSDFSLIVQNSLTFNGADHPVTKNAYAMKASFDKHMESLPSDDVKEAAPQKKKAPDPMAIRAPPSRRESRSSLPGSARSPVSAGSPQAFALGPEGIPLIRRDSTVDGRPKREIHRPAPRDLPYTHQKPKKKKFQWELKFCDHLLKEIMKPKYQSLSFPFVAPVDPVALNIPTYLRVVKKPMDFGTIRQKLDRGEYENAKEFEADARQVFKNCYLFNPEGDSINAVGKKFEAIFNEEWNKKREWLEENTPSSGQRSPISSDDEESEEEDAEEEEDEEQMAVVTKLQKQIAEMSKQVEMITSAAKKTKTPPVANKKVTKTTKASKKDMKKTAAPPPKAEKKAASKPVKKDKIPYVTYEQKQDISNRINSLSETKMSQALTIIRSNMPNLKGVQEDELELDIDELSNDVLYKLLGFVRKHAPRADDSPVRPVASGSTAAPTRKKNKPMSKHEQEARIAQVQSGLSAFQKGGTQNSCMIACPTILVLAANIYKIKTSSKASRIKRVMRRTTMKRIRKARRNKRFS